MIASLSSFASSDGIIISHLFFSVMGCACIEVGALFVCECAKSSMPAFVAECGCGICFESVVNNVNR